MGFGAPARSFGRAREEEKVESPVLVIPPLQLPQVQVPLVLVVDAQALAAAGEQIQRMVRQSILAGFSEAMGQAEVTVAETGGELAEHLHP